MKVYRPITIDRIIANLERARLTAAIMERKYAIPPLKKILDCNLTQGEFELLSVPLKPLIPGITREKLKAIYREELPKIKRLRQTRERRYRDKKDSLNNYTKRLFPLGDYEHFLKAIIFKRMIRDKTLTQTSILKNKKWQFLKNISFYGQLDRRLVTKGNYNGIFIDSKGIYIGSFSKTNFIKQACKNNINNISQLDFCPLLPDSPIVNSIIEQISIKARNNIRRIELIGNPILIREDKTKSRWSSSSYFEAFWVTPKYKANFILTIEEKRVLVEGFSIDEWHYIDLDQ